VTLDLQRASDQIDVLIERRASEAQREQANYEARAWSESVRKYNFARLRERRLEWCEYHRRQAALFEDLAREHREALGRLMDLGVAAGGRGEGVLS